MSELMARYGVGSPTMRRWLVDAGIEVRRPGAGGYRRRLVCPPRATLQSLGAGGRAAPQIAAQLGVSPGTVRRWFAENDLPPLPASRKNRPWGAAAEVRRPTRGELLQFYFRDGLSVEAVATHFGATSHLVRTWLLEDQIPIRSAGGRPGQAHTGRTRKPAPPASELRRLRERDRLGRVQLAARYGVHPQTVSKWLADAGLPSRLPPPGPAISDATIAALYRAGPLPAAEIARRLGVSDYRVLGALRRESVDVDPARQAAAVRAYNERRQTRPPLPARQTRQVIAAYRAGHSYRQVAEQLGVTTGKVRAVLTNHGVPGRSRPLIGPNSRSGRTQVSAGELRKLYVDSELPALDVAARLNSTPAVVYRTGHAHGIPIRQGGNGVIRPTAVVLVDELYRDRQISAALDRHAVPRRAAGGDIAARFPDPVPLTEALLRELYTDAGCSSTQIELLTGQPQIVVRDLMRHLGIPLRPDRPSPALRRIRTTVRDAFLAQVAAQYRESGSTAKVADLYGCTSTSVLRWLAAAGVTVPGRGHWPRPPRLAQGPGLSDNSLNLSRPK